MKEHVKEFKKRLKKARDLIIKAENAQQNVFEYLGGLGIDISDEIMDGFAIEEVVTTYIAYGDIECMDKFLKLFGEII